MVLIKSFLTGTLYDRSRLVYVLLNKGDIVPKHYSCLKFKVKANLHVVVFFKIFLLHLKYVYQYVTQYVSLKRFY